MSILCGALESFDSYLRSQETQLHVCVVVTGKGPLKAAFCEAVGRLQLTNVAVSTPWLEPEDYPAMIASADVGVSLHTSSSGVDLPMKVLDMFGCGVPVCAMEFLALSELVRPRVNGLTFKTAAELCEHLQELFTGFHDSAGSDATLLHTLRRGARRIERWDEQWHRYMQPLVLRMIHVARPRRNTAHTVSVVIVSIVVAFALGLTISWIQST
jgi:beta-1,4-mannosyltransferase